MDSDVIRAFHTSLNSVLEQRPPVNKPKIVEITKAALNSVRYFKHVVLIAEKFITKCRADYKLSGLYVIDSIVRQAKKQYQYKDVFAPRFATNLGQTLANVLECEAGERLKVVRVVNLWKANGIFDEATLDPILQRCKATGLEVDVYRVERAVKGDKANMQLYGLPQEPARLAAGATKQPKPSSSKSAPAAALPAPKSPSSPISPVKPRPSAGSKDNGASGSQQHLPPQLIATTDLIQLVGERDPQLGALLSLSNNSQMLTMVHQLVAGKVTELLEIEKRREGTVKNLLSRDFDYSDEEEDEDMRGGGKSGGPVVGKERVISMTREVLAKTNLNAELQQQMTLKLQQQLGAPAIVHQPPGALIGQQPGLMGMPGMLNFSVPPPMIPLQQQGAQASNPFSAARPAPQSLLSLVPQGVALAGVKEDHDQHFHRSSGGTAHRRFSPPRRDSHDRSDRDYRDSDRNRQSRKREHSRERDRDGRDRSRRGEPIDEGRVRKSDRRSSPAAVNTGRDRDRDRERDRDRDSEKDKERLERERERRKNGFPSRPKDDHILIASRTLWFGRLPSNCTEQDLADAVKEAGVPEKINVVGPRGCAYVTMPDRRTAYKIMDRLAKDLLVQRKQPKIDWAIITGIKDNQRLLDYWETKIGYAEIPFSKLPSSSLDSLLEGAWVDVATLPGHFKGQYNSRGDNIQLQQQREQQGLAMMAQQGAMPAGGGQMMTSGMTGLSQQTIASAINPAFLAAAGLAAFGGMAPPGTTPPPGLMGAGPGAGLYAGPPPRMGIAPMGMGIGGVGGTMMDPPRPSFRGFRIQGPPPRGGGHHGGFGDGVGGGRGGFGESGGGGRGGFGDGGGGGRGGGFSKSFGNGSFGNGSFGNGSFGNGSFADESTSMFNSSAGHGGRGRGGGPFQPNRGRGGGGTFWRGGGIGRGGGFRNSGGGGDFSGGEMGFFNQRPALAQQQPPPQLMQMHHHHLQPQHSQRDGPPSPSSGPSPQPLFSLAVNAPPPHFQPPQQHPEDPMTIRDQSPLAPNEQQRPSSIPIIESQQHESAETKSVGELLAQTDAGFDSYSPDSSSGGEGTQPPQQKHDDDGGGEAAPEGDESWRTET